MKTIERIMVKLVIVQLLFLILAQVFLHHFEFLPELKEISQYEGVTENNFSEFLETFNGTE